MVGYIEEKDDRETDGVVEAEEEKHRPGARGEEPSQDDDDGASASKNRRFRVAAHAVMFLNNRQSLGADDLVSPESFYEEAR